MFGLECAFAFAFAFELGYVDIVSVYGPNGEKRTLYLAHLVHCYRRGVTTGMGNDGRWWW